MRSRCDANASSKPRLGPSPKLVCLFDLEDDWSVTHARGPGDNQGRVFYTCPKPSREAQCKFFKWQDELDDPPSRANGAGAGRTVGGTGGGGGTPGECFKCGQVGHWSSESACMLSNPVLTSLPDACPNGDSRPGGSRSTNGGQQSNYTCHACGEQGHFSTNCPNKNAGAGNSAGNMDRSCFECGGQGPSASSAFSPGQ